MISLIVCYDKNKVIGYKNKMPWYIKRDLLHFKELTLNKVVIMGKNTFLSLKEPLKNRENVVISSTLIKKPGIKIFTSLEEALANYKDRDIFLIGGSNIYLEGYKYCKRLYITEIDGEFEGDTYFPNIDLNNFTLISKEDFIEQYHYSFLIYERKYEEKN